MTDPLPDHLAIALDLIHEWRANEDRPQVCYPHHAYVVAEWDPAQILAGLLTAVTGLTHCLEALSPGATDELLAELHDLYVRKYPIERITLIP